MQIFIKKVAKNVKMMYNYIRIVVIKMVKTLKILLSIIIVIIIQMQFSFCYAENIIDDVNVYKPDVDSYNATDDKLIEKVDRIVTAIRSIGIVVAVVSLMALGIRVMIGGTKEKSDYLKSLPGYLIGAILVIAITFLPSLIFKITQEMF